MKNIILLSLALICSRNAEANILFQDDFSGTNIGGNGFRLFQNDLDNGIWQIDVTSNSGDPSLWQITGGTLNNPTVDPVTGLAAPGKPSEGAASILFSVDPTDTNGGITFEFDYNLGTGTTLFFHALGLVENAGLAGNPQILNTQSQNGTIQDQREANYTDISLFDGTDPNGSTAFAQALTGSGTFSQTFDISSFASSGTTGISSVGDLDSIAIAFATNVLNPGPDAGFSIDNLVITSVPEPTSFLMLVIISLTSSLLIRKKRAFKQGSV